MIVPRQTANHHFEQEHVILNHDATCSASSDGYLIFKETI